jgi:hypothetical protein
MLDKYTVVKLWDLLTCLNVKLLLSVLKYVWPDGLVFTSRNLQAFYLQFTSNSQKKKVLAISINTRWGSLPSQQLQAVLCPMDCVIDQPKCCSSTNDSSLGKKKKLGLKILAPVLSGFSPFKLTAIQNITESCTARSFVKIYNSSTVLYFLGWSVTFL